MFLLLLSNNIQFFLLLNSSVVYVSHIIIERPQRRIESMCYTRHIDLQGHLVGGRRGESAIVVISRFYLESVTENGERSVKAPCKLTKECIVQGYGFNAFHVDIVQQVGIQVEEHRHVHRLASV